MLGCVVSINGAKTNEPVWFDIWFVKPIFGNFLWYQHNVLRSVYNHGKESCRTNGTHFCSASGLATKICVSVATLPVSSGEAVDEDGVAAGNGRVDELQHRPQEVCQFLHYGVVLLLGRNRKQSNILID